MDLSAIYQLYRGFYIMKPAGNNVFSFQKRRNKKIWVAPFKKGNIKDVVPGSRIVFSEIENGVEYNKSGIEYFIYLKLKNKHIFIFDNHNHAFFFWFYAIRCGFIKTGQSLVHIDQHSDLGQPEIRPNRKFSIDDAFHYTNFVLNVGNFIKPALQLGFFSELKIIDSSASFRRNPPDNFILDIDLDIFAPEMSYIDKEIKIAKLKEYINQTNFVTCATSPYFMDQDLALRIIKEILQ